MVTRRVNVWPNLGQWGDALDRQFNELWGKLAHVAPVVAGGVAYPSINLWEQGDNLYVEAEIPGVKAEELEISVVGNELTLKGRRAPAAEDAATFHRRERGVGSFTRVVRLPVEVDNAQVQASLNDGVLLVTLPKHEAAKPRKIKVASTT